MSDKEELKELWSYARASRLKMIWAAETIERAKAEIEQLRAINTDLLKACIAMLKTWGSDDEDAIIQARDDTRKAVEKALGV